MKLLIAGDSYSDIKYGDNWVKRFPEAECVARIGNSNYDIWMSIKERTWDLLVVNLTHPNRLSRASINDKQAAKVRLLRKEFPDTQKKLRYWSYIFADKIIKQPNVICWSPFPHYENNDVWSRRPLRNLEIGQFVHYKNCDEVNSIILPTEDDMWMDDPKDYRPDPIVGCHYTQKGNEIVYEKISGWINDWVNKK